MPMYNLIKYTINFSKTSGSLWQFSRNDPNHNITDSELFKFKSRFIINTGNTGTANIEIAVPLKHLSSFWKIIGRPLTNYEINLLLIFSANFVIS